MRPEMALFISMLITGSILSICGMIIFFHPEYKKWEIWMERNGKIICLLCAVAVGILTTVACTSGHEWFLGICFLCIVLFGLNVLDKKIRDSKFGTVTLIVGGLCLLTLIVDLLIQILNY